MSGASLRDIKDHLQFRVMWELRERGDGKGRAWPSEATLAECVGCCVKTVRKAIRGLEADGWLRVWRRHKRLNIYYLQRISAPGAPRRAHKRLSLQESQKSGEVGAASRPPDDFPSPASSIAPAAGLRDDAAQAETQNPSRSSEKTVLPEGWLPPDEDIAYALEHTDQNVAWCQREFAKFRDHCHLQGRVSACWQLEWRRWISRGLGYREKRLWRPSRRIALAA
jgi:hypothetical protein